MRFKRRAFAPHIGLDPTRVQDDGDQVWTLTSLLVRLGERNGTTSCQKTKTNDQRLSTHEHVHGNLADTVAGSLRSMVAFNAGKSAGHIQDDLPVRLFDRWEEIPRDEGRAGDVGDYCFGQVGRFEVECQIGPTVLHVRDEGKEVSQTKIMTGGETKLTIAALLRT